MALARLASNSEFLLTKSEINSPKIMSLLNTKLIKVGECWKLTVYIEKGFLSFIKNRVLPATATAFRPAKLCKISVWLVLSRLHLSISFFGGSLVPRYRHIFD
jgi:hypothetical protein